MKSYPKGYRVRLQTVGPVFVGSGRELSKREYLFLPNKKIGILDFAKLYQFMKKHHLLSQFEDYMVGRVNIDMGRWLEKNKIDRKDVRPCIKYMLDYGDTVLQRGTSVHIMEYIKDAYGHPYIPGSSLKGMLRTILLADKIMKEPKNYKDEIKDLNIAASKRGRRNTYLQQEIGQIETKAFRTLEREGTRSADAVNDIMSGFLVSDSNALDIKDIALCQKVERHVDGEETKLNLLRECIRPGTEIVFTITIDESICKITIQQVLDAVKKFNECYNECYISSFKGIDRLYSNSVYLGGGCGFVSKTTVYPAMGKKLGITFTQNMFKNINVPRHHQHYKDAQLGASPHILKCTWYEGKTLQMGLCRIKKIGIMK